MGRSLTPLTPIYSVAEIRALEAKAMAAAPNVSLMQKAGAAAAAHAKTLLGDSGKRILILAGPGNNGGDALEVAVLLKQQFFQVRVSSQAIPPDFPSTQRMRSASGAPPAASFSPKYRARVNGIWSWMACSASGSRARRRGGSPS